MLSASSRTLLASSFSAPASVCQDRDTFPSPPTTRGPNRGEPPFRQDVASWEVLVGPPVTFTPCMVGITWALAMLELRHQPAEGMSTDSSPVVVESDVPFPQGAQPIVLL